MPRKSLITIAALKRMAHVAKSEGVTIEADIDGVTFRVKPYEKEPNPSRDPMDFETIAEWQAWREAQRAKEAEDDGLTPW